MTDTAFDDYIAAAFANSPDVAAAFASLYGGGDTATQSHLIWRTIGAEGPPGDKHGGARVQLNSDTGEIEKGPKPMVGKKPSEVGPAMKHAHRREKREGIIRKAAAEHPEPLDEQLAGVIAANRENAVAKVKAKHTEKPKVAETLKREPVDEAVAKAMKPEGMHRDDDGNVVPMEEPDDSDVLADGGESESATATEIPDAHELTPDDYHYRYTRLVNPMAAPDESWHEQEKAVTDALDRGEEVPDHVRVEFGHPTAEDEQKVAEHKAHLPTDEMVAEAMKVAQRPASTTTDKLTGMDRFRFGRAEKGEKLQAGNWVHTFIGDFGKLKDAEAAKGFDPAIRIDPYLSGNRNRGWSVYRTEHADPSKMSPDEKQASEKESRLQFAKSHLANTPNLGRSAGIAANLFAKHKEHGGAVAELQGMTGYKNNDVRRDVPAALRSLYDKSAAAINPPQPLDEQVAAIHAPTGKPMAEHDRDKANPEDVAKFRGWQKTPKGPIPLYDLKKSEDHHPAGSTVTAGTLEKLDLTPPKPTEPPPAPPLDGQIAAANAPEPKSTKQPWEMKPTEYLNHRDPTHGSNWTDGGERLVRQHADHVRQQIIRDPSKVPDEVLQEMMTGSGKNYSTNDMLSEWTRRYESKASKPHISESRADLVAKATREAHESGLRFQREMEKFVKDKLAGKIDATHGDIGQEVYDAKRKLGYLEGSLLDEVLASKNPAPKDLFGREVFNPISGDTLPMLHEPKAFEPAKPIGADAKIAKQYDPKATAMLPMDEAVAKSISENKSLTTPDKGSSIAATSNKGAAMEKQPYEMTLKEYQGAGHTGYIQGHMDDIKKAISEGKAVPENIIDQYAPTIEFSERQKLASRHGGDWSERLKSLASQVKEISEVVSHGADGKMIIRRRQLPGGSFQNLAKGDIIAVGETPHIITKALKPHVGRTENGIHGYYQEVVSRPAKPGEADRNVAAAAALQDGGRPNNVDYPDLKKEQMAKYASLVDKALSK